MGSLPKVDVSGQIDLNDGEKLRPNNKYTHYALVLLTIGYVLNTSDRYILSIVQEQVKVEFLLADWQLGFIGGTAFALFYAICGLPLAVIAERKSRVSLISASIVLWSGMTMVCGAASSVWMFLIGRFGVGVGEAGATPATHSLIAAYYPPHQRARALSVYSSGMPIGTMAVAILGGWIASNYGWRAPYFVFGVPGILLGVLVFFTLKEPRRPPFAEGGSSFWRISRKLFAIPTYRNVVIAAVIFAFANIAIVQFLPSFFIRTHHLTLTQATLIFGLCEGVFAFVGTIAGGVLVDKLHTRTAGIAPMLAAGGVLAGAILTSIAFISSDLRIGLSALMVGKFAQWLAVGPSFFMIQSVAPERGRAIAQALYLFCTGLIGAGLGPLTIGAISDLAARQFLTNRSVDIDTCSAVLSSVACETARADGLNVAMIVFCTLFLVSAFFYLKAKRHFVEEMTRY